MYRQEQKREFEFLRKLNNMSSVEYPDDPALRARIKSYELAFRMQMSVPEALEFKQENEETKRLYGLDNEVTKPFGEICLGARRLSERGVRFVQLYHGGNAGAGKWDAHSKIKKNYDGLCPQVDKPIAGLLKDLKQRGHARRDACRLGDRVRTHARRRTRIGPRSSPVRLFRSGWRVGASSAGSFTEQPTSSDSTPWRIATTSRMFTPRSFTSSASTQGDWKYPAASASISTSATPSAKILI